MKNPARHPDGLDGNQTRGSRLARSSRSSGSGGLGIVLTSIGGAGLLWIGFQIIQDMTGDLVRYSYKPPFTQHETANLVFLAVSVVLILSGVVGMVRGAFKKRNQLRTNNM